MQTEKVNAGEGGANSRWERASRSGTRHSFWQEGKVENHGSTGVQVVVPWRGRGETRRKKTTGSLGQGLQRAVIVPTSGGHEERL